MVEIKFRAVVYCNDGIGGYASHILINERNRKVSFLVVQGSRRGEADWVVPIGVLAASQKNEIRLHCSLAQLRQFEQFTALDFPTESLEEIARRAGGQNPYAMLNATLRQSFTQNIPPGHQVICWGTPVEAADGKVAQISAVYFEPRSLMLSALLIFQGALWHKKEFVLPAHTIQEIEPDCVHLRVNSRQIEAQQKQYLAAAQLRPAPVPQHYADKRNIENARRE